MDRRDGICMAVVATVLWAGAARCDEPATQAAEAKTDARAAWRKIWAYRAARAEAAAAIARQIEDLPLAADAKVGEFLGESPLLQQALNAFLLGVEPAEAPHHEGDACRVVLEVPVSDVAAALGEIRDRYYQGEKFRETDFARIGADRKAPLRQEAQAKAHPALLAGPLIPRKANTEYFSRAGAEVRKLWQRHVKTEGRPAAERRARQDAMRRLGERVKEVRIDGTTRLGDYVGSSGQADVASGQFLRAAREKGLRYHPDAPIVEVEITVSLRTVYACLKAWALRHGRGQADIHRLEALIVAARGASISQAGIAAAEPDELKKRDEKILRAIAPARAAPAWFGRALRQTGRAKGRPAGRKKDRPSEKSIRAAEWHARTALAGRMAELPTTEKATVGELAGRDENAGKALLAVLLGATPAAEPTLAEDGQTELTLELPLGPLWQLVFYWQRNAPPAKS